jgi:hypothetical protein
MKDNVLLIFIHLHKSGGTTFNVHLEKHFKEKFIHLDFKEDQLKFNKLSKSERENIKVLAGHETYYKIHKKFLNKIPKYIVFVRDPAKRLVSQYNHHMAQRPNNKQISFREWYEKYPKNEMVSFFSKRSYPFQKKIQRNNLFQRILPKMTSTKLWKNLIYFFKSINIQNKENKLLKNSKELLDKCWFIGITENLDNDLKFLCNYMGIPAKWENRRVTGNPTTWKNIQGKNSKVSYKKLKLTPSLKAKIYKENPFDVELYEYAKKLNRKIYSDLQTSN